MQVQRASQHCGTQGWSLRHQKLQPACRQLACTHVAHAWKLPDLKELLGPRLGAGPRASVPKVPPAASKLLGLLLQGQPPRQEVDALIDELAALNVPFREQDLSGGPGVVAYTRGTVALWDAIQRPAPKSGKRANRASQDLEAAQRSVINKAEFWGPDVFVTASGTYNPTVDEEQDLCCPVPVEAFIRTGKLHWGEWELPLPIKGRGQFEVVYCDKDLRIFRSGGSWSVQVKESLLPE